MSKNTSVTLGPDYEAFIQRQIAKGRFGTVSEAIRAAVRRLQEEELKMEDVISLSDLDPGISSAIVKGRNIAIPTLREIARIELGDISDEKWELVRREWERHNSLATDVLQRTYARHL